MFLLRFFANFRLSGCCIAVNSRSVASLFLVLVSGLGSQVIAADKRDVAPLPPQVEKIDKALQQGWLEAEVRPSPAEDELKWCRRLFLDVIGRIPSYDELAEFAKDKTAGKKQNLLNRLLNDDRYTEEYAAALKRVFPTTEAR